MARGGCGGPGYRPRDPTALRAYLHRILEGHRQNLAAWEAEASPRLASNRSRAMATWRDRIARVEGALGRLA